MPSTFKRGDRIAQLIIAPVVQAEFIETTQLDETQRGDQGLDQQVSHSPIFLIQMI